VPRLIPRLTPFRGRAGEYSAERFWKHREYRASLGCAIVLLILIAKIVFLG